MKFDIPQEWSMRMVRAEADAGVDAQFSAGSPTAFDRWKTDRRSHEGTALEAPDTFGKVLQMMRHERRLTVESLARQASIDLGELRQIETGDFGPQPVVVHKLAGVFGVPPKNLMEVAGLVKRRNTRLTEAAVRFAASADPSAKLTDAERAAWEEFVRELSK
jgi:transcriptional regulator with XRE-family HTH domain